MPTQMEYALGLGVQAMVEAQTLRVGSERFMRQSGIDTTALEREAAEHSREGNSLIYIAAEDRLIGLLAYSDPPRPESALVLQALRARGLERIVMLTGDNALAARSVARELGITDVIADAFPERKVEVVQGLRAQGYTVAVIGDGVNDAPAFAHADVSISLAHGADVAKETADIILLDGDLWGLPRAIDLAKGSMGILHQNLQIVLAPTAVGMVGSVAGMINPLVSTLINNGTTVVAGLNALRPMRFQAHSDVPESRPLLPP